MIGYCINIYTHDEPIWLKNCELSIKRHPKYGLYWQTEVYSNRDKNKIVKKLNKRNIKHRCYEKRWERSSNYRDNFFKTYTAPYRCRYCNKSLTKEKMVIDHIVPIGKVKKSTNARMLLYIQNISEVNDVKNLAPSCRKCNQRKSDKLGLWYLKGILGKYKLYWILRRLIIFSLLLLSIYFLYQQYLIH